MIGLTGDTGMGKKTTALKDSKQTKKNTFFMLLMTKTMKKPSNSLQQF
jgi:hypothetical protein